MSRGHDARHARDIRKQAFEMSEWVDQCSADSRRAGAHDVELHHVAEMKSALWRDVEVVERELENSRIRLFDPDNEAVEHEIEQRAERELFEQQFQLPFGVRHHTDVHALL